MLDEMEVQKHPYNQMSVKKSLAAGAAAGLLLACCILGVLSLLRRTARGPEEMKQVTSLKCLAMIPHIQVKARKNQSRRRISVLDERTPYGYRESMRSLRVRLGRAAKEEGCTVVLVTSTAPGEGKSVVAVNLAQSLAADGKEVLLIDGDMRNQSDGTLLGIKGRYDLKDVAENEKGGAGLIGRVRGSGLHFLGSARKYKKTAAILTAEGVRAFIESARERMDYVILDSPACEMFQDAGLLAEYADLILYVVQYDLVPQNRIREGLASLSGRRASFAGYVFNQCPETGGVYGYGRYGYGYGYGYGYRKYAQKQEEGEAL